MTQKKYESILQCAREVDKMSGSTSLSLEKMRKERRTYESVYMKFVNSGKYYKSHAFCFYEGEDGKYYDSRIRQKFEDKFITFKVGNKKEVLKLLERITSTNLYDKVCTMFFIDRDYDVSKSDYNQDLFETPCYSIENFYVKHECLTNILQSEFGLNIVDEDYKKCLQDFKVREREFNESVLEFNALVFLRRQKSESNSNYSFSSLKTSRMIKVDVDKIVKANRYEETIKGIKEQLEIEQYEIENAKKELEEKGDYSNNFRGKNQLDFFVEFIKKLKQLNDDGGYFSVKYNNIHINLTSNRLSELSQYAVTPSELENFLERHKKEFILIRNSN